MPKITVMIPSYNHAKFIGEAIQSVLNQSFQDFEVLVVDDCSSDNSVEVIKQFNDRRINLRVNKENQGANYVVNQMIGLAMGEYLALLNSDDVWEVTKLEKQVKCLDNSPDYAAVFSHAHLIDEESRVIESEIPTGWFCQTNRTRDEVLNYFFKYGNLFIHPSVLIRANIYKEIGQYNELLVLTPDFDMWVRICLKYPVFVLQEKLTYLRMLPNEQNASASSIENTIRFQIEYEHILDNFLHIRNIAELRRIFPEHAEIFELCKPDDIELALAMIAVKGIHPAQKHWGLKVLYQVLFNKKHYLNEKSAFVKAEWFKLAKSIDPFNLKVLASKDQIINQKENLLKNAQEIIQTKDNLLKQAQAVIQAKENIIDEQEKIIKAKHILIVEKEYELVRKDNLIKDLEQKLSVSRHSLRSKLMQSLGRLKRILRR
ncbi:MAG: glycosyltransferase [Burkholderiales bacterium]